MSNDEEVAYAAIAAVAQAKIEQYSSVLDRDKRGVCSKQGGEVGRPIGADARAAAEMLVAEEKAVLVDLKLQLMGAVSPSRRRETTVVSLDRERSTVLF